MNVNKALFRFIKIALVVLFILLVIYGTVRLCMVSFDFGYRVFNEPAVAEAPGEDIMIQITEDMSAKELGDMLEDKGLVNDGTLFAIQLTLSAYKDDMAEGVYTLNTSMTAKEMMVEIAEVNEAKASAATEESETGEESEESEDAEDTTESVE